MPYDPADIDKRKESILRDYLADFAGPVAAPQAPAAPRAPAAPSAMPPQAPMAGEPDGDEDAQKEAIMREILGGISPLGGAPIVNKYAPKLTR